MELQSKGYGRTKICKELGLSYYPLDYLIRKKKLEKERIEYLKVLKAHNQYMENHLKEIFGDGKNKVCKFCKLNIIEDMHDDSCIQCKTAFEHIKVMGD